MVTRREGDTDVDSRIDPDRVPSHVAIIMDGNGRWANAQGLTRTAGHEAGESALFDVVEGALVVGHRFASCPCRRNAGRRRRFRADAAAPVGCGPGFSGCSAPRTK